MEKTTRLYTKSGGMILTLIVLFSLSSAMIGKARADEDDWRGHEREAHEWHSRHFHHGRRILYDYEDPYLTYAPPVVVEPPPRVYYPQQPGINFIIPLHIR